MSYTEEEARTLAEYARIASAPNGDYQTERLMRAKHRMAPEYVDLAGIVDPETVKDAQPLTKSQQKNWEMVMAFVFPPQN